MKPCCERDHNNDGDCDVHPPIGKIQAQLDPRIRRIVGNYRVIAPDAKSKGGTVYLNGRLVIEKRCKNALGEDSWSHVGIFAKSDIVDDMDEAIYFLLGGVTT